MNAIRKRAARIALYIECAGIAPVVSGSTYQEQCDSLEEQYCNIDSELRRSLRLEGRRLIRQQGISAVAFRLIPVPWQYVTSRS